MDDDTRAVCGNCGQPLPAGRLGCSHCGRQPRGVSILSMIARGLALFLGMMMTVFGTLCSVVGLMAPPTSLVVLLITLPVAVFGILLVHWSTDRDEGADRPARQDGAMRMRFGPRGDGK